MFKKAKRRPQSKLLLCVVKYLTDEPMTEALLMVKLDLTHWVASVLNMVRV